MKGNVVTRITAVVAAAAIAVTGISASGVTAKAAKVDVLHPSEAMAKGFKLVGKNVHVGEFGDYMIDIPDNWVPWENESMIFYGYTDCVELGYWIAKNDPSQSDDSLVYFATDDKSKDVSDKDKYWTEFSTDALKQRLLFDTGSIRIPRQIAEQYIYISDLRKNPAGINYYYGEVKIPADVSRQYNAGDGGSGDSSIYSKYYLYDGKNNDIVYIRQQGREHAQNPDFDSMALSLRPYVKPAPEKPKMKLYSKKGAKSIKQIFAILNKAKKKNDPDHDPEDYLIGKKVYGKVSGIKGFDVTIKDAKTKKKIIINTDRADGMEVGKSYVFKIDYLDGFNKKCIKASEPDSTVS